MSKTTVKDPWFQIAGGYKCYLNSPRLSLPNREIVREVLPRTMSKICRFGAHINRFYSLAQHVCGVERWVAANGGTTADRLQALLHDGGEGILGGDIPKPVREKIFGYDELEERFLSRIMELYELPAEPSSIVWDGDVALLVVEAEALEEGGPIEKWTDRYLKPGIDRTKILAQAFGPFQGTEFPVWSIASSEKILGDRLDALTRQHLKEIRQEPAAY